MKNKILLALVKGCFFSVSRISPMFYYGKVSEHYIEESRKCPLSELKKFIKRDFSLAFLEDYCDREKFVFIFDILLGRGGEKCFEFYDEDE